MFFEDVCQVFVVEWFVVGIGCFGEVVGYEYDVVVGFE